MHLKITKVLLCIVYNYSVELTPQQMSQFFARLTTPGT